MSPALLSIVGLSVGGFASTSAVGQGAHTPVVEQAPPEAAAPPATDERTASNVVFFEPLGNGLLYSLNYARIFERWHLGVRGGASYFTWAVSKYGGSGNMTLVSVPMVASYYFSLWRTAHHFELGLGATVLYSVASSDSTGTSFEGERTGLGLAGTAVVGYRYLPRDGGVTFGAGFTPLVRPSKFLPWGGISVGYAF